MSPETVEGAIFECVKQGAPHDYRFPWRNFCHLLASRAQDLGEKPALIYRDVDTGSRDVTTYAELDADTARLARVLHHAHGIGPGDAVSLALPNCREVTLLTLALFRLGATSVPLDLKRDVPQRKRYKVADSGSRLVCALPESREREQSILPDLPVISTSDLLEADAPGSADFEPDWSGDPETEQGVNVVLYTSGTTGNPKGVLLTRQSITSNADGIVQWLEFGSDDRLSLLLPLHHINSTVFSLTMLMTGGTLILNSRYSVHAFWPVLAEERATATSIVPTIMQDLLHAEETHPDDLDITCVRKIMIGSAPVPAGPAVRFFDTFGVPLIQGYGSTETSLRVTGVPASLEAGLYRQILKQNAIGTELANANVRIDGDPEAGGLGEILVRGPVVARGYQNQPDATAESFRDGWFRTGDVGFWREVGGRIFFFIHGRKKEIIIKGGVNISPIAVENALVEGVDEIQAAYVVGIDSERYGEEVCAVVCYGPRILPAEWDARAATTRALACKGGIVDLAPYEAPQVVIAMSPDDLPRTSTGKIQRSALKQIVAARLSQEASGQA